MGNTISTLDSDEQGRQSGQGCSAPTPPATSISKGKSWVPGLTISRHHKVLEDLLLSERRYVDDMQTLIDVFYSPLVRWVEQQEDYSKSGDRALSARTDFSSCYPAAVSRAEVEAVFSNVHKLIVFSRRLLPALERARTGSKAMMMVMLQLATSFKVYDVFMANCAERQRCLARMESNPAVAAFIKACELQERCRGLGLRDLLVMPLQRISQYRLLVESTAENCPPHLAALQRELALTLKIPPAVAIQVLEFQQKGVNVDRKEKVSPTEPPSDATCSVAKPSPMATASPKCIKEGLLTKICQDGPSTVRFLRGDKLLYSASVRSEEATRTTDCQPIENQSHYISLRRCFVIDGFAAPLEACFIVVSAQDSFLVEAETRVEKRRWVAAIRSAMEEVAITSGMDLSSCSKSDCRTHHPALEVDANGDGCIRSLHDQPDPQSSPVEERTPQRTRWLPNHPKTGGSTRSCKKWQDNARVIGSKMTPGRKAREAWRRRRSPLSKAPPEAAIHAEEGNTPGPEAAEVFAAVSPTQQYAEAKPAEAHEERKGEYSLWVARDDDSGGKIIFRENIRLRASSDDAAWNGTVGFHRVLADPPCYASFRDDLRMRHASENLEFREAVERYRSLFPSDSLVRAPACNHRRQGADKWHEENVALEFLWNDSFESGDSAPIVDTPRAAARGIVQRFVDQGAPEQVNLSEKVRETILRRQAEDGDAEAESMPPVDLFDEAFVEITVLLQRDSYVKFQNTEAFRRFKHRRGQQLNGIVPASEVTLIGPDHTTTTTAAEGLPKLCLPPPPPSVPEVAEGALSNGSSCASSEGGKCVPPLSPSTSASIRRSPSPPPSTTSSGATRDESGGSSSASTTTTAEHASSRSGSSGPPSPLPTATKKQKVVAGMMNARSKILRPKTSHKLLQRRRLASRVPLPSVVPPPPPPVTPATPWCVEGTYTMDQQNIRSENTIGSTNVVSDSRPVLLTRNGEARRAHECDRGSSQTRPVGDKITGACVPRCAAPPVAELNIQGGDACGSGSIASTREQIEGCRSPLVSSTPAVTFSIGRRTTGNGHVRHPVVPPKTKWHQMPPLPPAPPTRQTEISRQGTSAPGTNRIAKGVTDVRPEPPHPRVEPAAVEQSEPTPPSNRDATHAKTVVRGPRSVVDEPISLSAALTRASASAPVFESVVPSPGEILEQSATPPINNVSTVATEGSVTTPSAETVAAVAPIPRAQVAVATEVDEKRPPVDSFGLTTGVATRVSANSKRCIPRHSSSASSLGSADPPKAVEPLLERTGSAASRGEVTSESPMTSPPHPPPRLIQRCGKSLNDSALSSWKRKNVTSSSQTNKATGDSASRSKTAQVAVPPPVDLPSGIPERRGGSRGISNGNNGGKQRRAGTAAVEAKADATDVDHDRVCRSGEVNAPAPSSSAHKNISVSRGRWVYAPRNGGSYEPGKGRGGKVGGLGRNRGTRIADQTRQRVTGAALAAAEARAAADGGDAVEFSRPDMDVRLELKTSPGTNLGVQIANDDGIATIYGFRPVPDGRLNAAEEAGLCVGDVLVSVSGFCVLGNFQQAIELMKRGQEKGEMSFVVRREAAARNRRR